MDSAPQQVTKMGQKPYLSYCRDFYSIYGAICTTWSNLLHKSILQIRGYYSVSMITLTLYDVKLIGNIQPDQVKVYVYEEQFMLTCCFFCVLIWTEWQLTGLQLS